MVTAARPLFVVDIPSEDVTPTVRRALASMDQANPPIVKLVECLESVGLKCNVPFHFTDCYAHIGIPGKKVAIFVDTHGSFSKYRLIKQAWEASKDGAKWSVLFTSVRQIENMTSAELKANVLAMVKSPKK